MGGLSVFRSSKLFACVYNKFSGRGDVLLLLTDLSKVLAMEKYHKRSDVVILDEITHLTPLVHLDYINLIGVLRRMVVSDKIRSNAKGVPVPICGGCPGLHMPLNLLGSIPSLCGQHRRWRRTNLLLS